MCFEPPKETIVSIRFLCSPVLSYGDSAPPPLPPQGGTVTWQLFPPGYGGTITRQGAVDKGGRGYRGLRCFIPPSFWNASAACMA